MVAGTGIKSVERPEKRGLIIGLKILRQQTQLIKTMDGLKTDRSCTTEFKYGLGAGKALFDQPPLTKGRPVKIKGRTFFFREARTPERAAGSYQLIISPQRRGSPSAKGNESMPFLSRSSH